MNWLLCLVVANFVFYLVLLRYLKKHQPASWIVPARSVTSQFFALKAFIWSRAPYKFADVRLTLLVTLCQILTLAVTAWFLLYSTGFVDG